MEENIKVKTKAVKTRDGVWDLCLTCPYCGKEHHHGGGDGAEPILGYRAPHCTGDKTDIYDYCLVPES